MSFDARSLQVQIALIYWPTGSMDSETEGVRHLGNESAQNLSRNKFTRKANNTARGFGREQKRPTENSIRMPAGGFRGRHLQHSHPRAKGVVH